MKFDPLLDFYDPTLSPAARNQLLKELYELSEQLYNSTQGLIEIPRPSFVSRFCTAYQLHYVSRDLSQYLDEFYPDLDKKKELPSFHITGNIYTTGYFKSQPIENRLIDDE